MIYIFLALLIFIYGVCPDCIMLAMGISNDNLWGCLTYSFAHASWLHLLINCLALALMYKPIENIWLKRFMPADVYSDIFYKIEFAFVVYVCAVLAGLLAAQDIPTVGASGLAYALLGMLLMLNPTLRQLKNYICVGLVAVLQCFFGHSNVVLHICAFVFGAVAVIIRCAREHIRTK